MKIAVTYENGNVFQHFGHSERFKLYNIENDVVTTAVIIDTMGSGHGALAGFLKQCKVDALICGGIGGGAKRALSDAGIKLYGGVSGAADAAVNALLADKLSFDSDAECDHHGEHHGGECHDHDCKCSN